MEIGDRIAISKGRLRREKGRIIGTTDLNMEYKLIVHRENKKARDKIMGFRPDELCKQGGLPSKS